jgi:hypothetical protein
MKNHVNKPKKEGTCATKENRSCSPSEENPPFIGHGDWLVCSREKGDFFFLEATLEETIASKSKEGERDEGAR